ncbi:TIM21-domain-containing protein [Morchella conica CCBAS932]|uniref:Mitochondrial import inner membrane translocase subunit Tim21 n=1 Tax=Morchella conica CCBAS932 TaxID=1392247 RepID=A0A3N4KDA0_9PEZI|nr:TIM21-domain-containing protein [Morchella conica CCBAS932]
MSALRAPARLTRRLPPAAHRLLSTTPHRHADSQRQQISISPATPHKKWADLSATQKAARTASTSANLITIVAGMALTGAVFTLLYLEVFAPDSAANWFNTIHARVRADERCVGLLGNRIKAYGEPTSNRWSRNRPIASKTWKDKYGVEHLVMHFNVEGHIDRGVVNAHLVKRPGEGEYTYQYLFLEVSGKPRIYLEKDESKTEREGGPKKRLFGVQWGW